MSEKDSFRHPLRERVDLKHPLVSLSELIQTKAPIDPSSLTHWRKRLDKEGVERMRLETIDVAKRAKAIKNTSVKKAEQGDEDAQETLRKMGK